MHTDFPFACLVPSYAGTRSKMEIADWRKQIDEIDHKLVELINQRAIAAKEIGKLKRVSNAPVYEPQREKEIHDRVRQANSGPLADADLQHIFERIIDVMRAIQREDMQPKPATPATTTPADTE